MGNKKPARDDHFIPKGYLRKFSIDPLAKVPQIYQFDIAGIARHQAVSTRSICYKDRLYEIKNANGEIIVENGIENSIRIYENAFYKVRNTILKKLFVSNWKNAFCDKEKSTLLLMIVLQLLRYDDTFQRFKDIINQVNPQNTTPEYIKDIVAKIACLPLFLNYDGVEMTSEMRTFKNWANHPPLLYGIIDKLSNHNLCLGYKNGASIWICDRPVIVRTCNQNNMDLIIYPISPECVLYVYSNDVYFPHKNNSIFNMTEEEIDFINKEIVVNANRWIYSNHELSPKEQKTIFETRKAINDKLISTNGVAFYYPIDNNTKEQELTFNFKINKKKKRKKCLKE